MRRFFRTTELAALIGLTLVAAPLANRLAAQDSQPVNADSGVGRDSASVTGMASTAGVAGASVAPSSSFDLRDVHPQSAPSVVRVEAPLAVSMTGLRSGVHARENVGPLVVKAAPANANLGQARALMIVGAAALVAGAIIGDDPGTIIMVGGAVVGLYGLYQYLQ